MTMNTKGGQPSSRPGDTTVVEPTPSLSPTGVGGVAVYDTDTATNPNSRPSAIFADDHLADSSSPVEARSGSSMVTWIISAIVLIVLAYFLLQLIF